MNRVLQKTIFFCVVCFLDLSIHLLSSNHIPFLLWEKKCSFTLSLCVQKMEMKLVQGSHVTLQSQQCKDKYSGKVGTCYFLLKWKRELCSTHLSECKHARVTTPNAGEEEQAHSHITGGSVKLYRPWKTG